MKMNNTGEKTFWKDLLCGKVWTKYQISIRIGDFETGTFVSTTVNHFDLTMIATITFIVL